ncbi:MAG: FkbM family methyltransferase [Rubrivivax sp.]|nr:FkbM family methyltransferase [Rubrivivax sp.]
MATSRGCFKIDIEGSEGHFVDHELDFIKRCKYVVIEIHRWLVQPDDVRQRLEAVGLRLTKVIGNEQDAEVHLYVREGLAARARP